MEGDKAMISARMLDEMDADERAEYEEYEAERNELMSESWD